MQSHDRKRKVEDTMANTQRLKYLGHSIVFQEVPNEISLAINISGCPYKCRGCHSSYLWEYKGRYVSDDIEALINEHDGITCVCFMGGDQNPQELNELIDYVHLKGLKVCLYTGNDDIPDGIHNLNYLKIGRYVEKCGGLDKPTTNQKFYVVHDDKDYFDITSLFRKEQIINVKDNQESR